MGEKAGKEGENMFYYGLEHVTAEGVEPVGSAKERPNMPAGNLGWTGRGIEDFQRNAGTNRKSGSEVAVRILKGT